jgi:heavy metal sensor kinase
VAVFKGHRPRLRGRSAFWRTLRFRFAVWVAGLLFLMIAVLAAVVYVSLARSLSKAVNYTLQLSGGQAVSAIEFESNQISFSASVDLEIVEEDLEERGLTIRLVSPGGEILKVLGANRSLPVSPKALAAASSHQGVYETLRDPAHGDDRVRLYTTPVLHGGQLVGIVQVAQGLDRVDDTLERLQILLALSTPLAIVIAGLGGYALVARALSRVDRITQTARRISAEDLSQRLHLPPTNDEVGRLATTFDTMLTRLDASFQRERQFTADASHELRTPLAAMQVILSAVLEKRRSPEEYEQALADIAEETDRMRALVEDLLLLARREAAHAVPHEAIDMSLLLCDIVETLSPLAEAKGLSLSCTAPPQLTLQGDQDGLIRLFSNLLDNAIKYTDHGEIVVRADRTSDDLLRVTVTDTGCGIPAEHVPHIFERFYRAEASRTRRGAGLGLTIAMDIARAHAGTIQVESLVGAGTTFTILLSS